MPGLFAYAAAGGLAGAGAGIVERAKALREEAMLNMKRQWDQDDAQQQHDWRMEEIGLRDSLKGGGRRRSGGGGGGGGGGDLAPGESVYTSGGGIMPAGGAARPDPMALEEQGTSNPDEYKTYGYDDPAPAAADGADAAPAEGARVPDVSHTPAKLTGEKEIDGYLFGRAGNRWYPYIGPDGGPVKGQDISKKGVEEAELPPTTKQDEEAPSLTAPEVERYAPDRERPKPDTKKPQGLMPGALKAQSEDSADVPKDGPVTKLPKGEPKALAPSSVSRLERSLRDSRGTNLDAQTFSAVIDEIEALMGEGKTEAQATNDVMSRLDREKIVTNKPGTVASRLLGLTAKDAPPDEVKEGKIKGVKPRATDPQAPGLKAPPAGVIASAQAAIAKGASREAVIARLKDNGYSAEGI